MVQENKNLLLKDLCARLPYFENWVQYEGKDYIVTGYGHRRVSLLSSPFSSASGPCPLIEEVKPYLRPMSSMTDDERDELRNVGGVMSHDVQNDTWALCAFAPEAYDWLNEHHFDYRDLIDRGLALEAPKGMYEETKED